MEGEHTRAEKQAGISRKTLFKAALIATPVPLLIGQVPALARQTAESGGPLTPTPYCDDGDDPTMLLRLGTARGQAAEVLAETAPAVDSWEGRHI
ncbi:hypothetical protein ACWEPC_59475, partial [Nonomuraea sp. NPDC004297]